MLNSVLKKHNFPETKQCHLCLFHSNLNVFLSFKQSEHPAHQFGQATYMPGMPQTLQNGCEGLSYSTMAMKAFELPSNDSIYQANLYQVSPKPTQINPVRASSVRSDQSPAHGHTDHHSPSPAQQSTDNNNGLHV